MKLLVINGPNLNLLGIREPGHYGKENYQQLLEKIQRYCDEKGHEVSFFQSNHEGALVDAIQQAYFDKVEEREDFRQVSFIRQACIGTVTGLGTDGYLRAIDRLEAHYAG